jgi:alpha-D-ribose 1-methylphosphonate 5-triphosphate synthase subunit PhnH
VLTRDSDIDGLRGAFSAPPPSSHQFPRRAGSQQLGRAGSIVELNVFHQAPEILCEAAAAVALALFDQDTRVWLSPISDCASVRKYLRGHTGCIPVAEPTLADFAIVARPGELPPLGSFHRGTQADPGCSSKLIVQVVGLEDVGPLRLSGPGMQGAMSIAAKGLGAAFLTEWAHNARLLPRGVDVLLTCGRRLCVLPRTTRIDV